MTYLIDTHILLWFIEGDNRLNRKDVKIIEDTKNTIFISSASLQEIAIKISIGKLKLSIDLEELKSFLKENDFGILDFTFHHLQQLIDLPFHHQDPFDRLIISQAKVDGLQLITNDHKFRIYGV